MSITYGVTSNQMANAPVGALYVWPVAATLHLPKLLAKQLDRGDLEVIAAGRFRNSSFGRGIRKPIVVDHACYELCESRVLTNLQDYIDRQKAREAGETLAKGL